MATEIIGAGVSALGGLFAGLGAPSIENARPDPNYQLVSDALTKSGGSLSGGSIMGEALAHAQGLRNSPLELASVQPPQIGDVRVPGMPTSIGIDPGITSMVGDVSAPNTFRGDWTGANPGQGGGGPGGWNPDNDGTRPPAQNNNWGGGPGDVTGGTIPQGPGGGVAAARMAGETTYDYNPEEYLSITESLDRAIAELSLRSTMPRSA